MPTLIRLISVLAFLAAIVYGGAWYIVEELEPPQADIVTKVPNDSFAR